MKDVERNKIAFEIMLELHPTNSAARKKLTDSKKRLYVRQALAWKWLIEMILFELTGYYDKRQRDAEEKRKKYLLRYSSIKIDDLPKLDTHPLEETDLKKRISVFLSWSALGMGQKVLDFFMHRICTSEDTDFFMVRHEFYERILTGLMDKYHNT